MPAVPSGTQNGPFSLATGVPTKKMVPQNFRNHFSRTKISPRFGFVPSNPPKGPKKYPNTKKAPKGGSVPLGPPQLVPIKRWCESHVLANGRTKPSIDPQYLTFSRRLYPLLAPYAHWCRSKKYKQIGLAIPLWTPNNRASQWHGHIFCRGSTVACSLC